MKWAAVARRKPRPGDLVEVVWIDHAKNDNDAGPECPIFRTPGYFKEIRDSNGHSCLFTARNVRVKGSTDFEVGWDSYPMCAVLEIVVR